MTSSRTHEEATGAPTESTNGFLDRVFRSCSTDPRGSVHRAWGISLLFVVVYFIVAILEMINIHKHGGSFALVIASIWSGLVHLGLGVLGTFVLKRFPTSFSVGFLLGVLVVLANQNLLLFADFLGYGFGTPQTNTIFALLGLLLFLILGFMATLLVHFKHKIIMVPVGGASVGDASTAYLSYPEGGASTTA